jgi:Dipeptidyl aminopeptidases/acylaminoacyl-peptidases
MRTHHPLFFRRWLFSIIIIFIASLVWSVYGAFLDPLSSTSRAVSRNQQGIASFNDLSLAQVEGSTYEHSTNAAAFDPNSALYQLTSGLRPGRGDVIPPARDVEALPVFDISFYNQRGNLISGWLALRAPHAPVIILTHGTPGNRVDMVSRAAFLFEHGYNVLLFDFQSYGQSQGVLSTLGMIESEDILAAITYLHSFPDTDDSKIGVLGLSMGATAAVLAAAHTNDILALVAESCPVDATRVPGDVPDDQVRAADKTLVEDVYGVDITQARPLDAVDRLAGHTALFLINGDIDTQTPLAGMYQLYNAAGEPKQYWVVAGANHAQSFAVSPDSYIAHVDAFFDSYLANAS